MDGGAWWAAVYGVAKHLSRTGLSDFTFTFHFHALEKEMATHSSVLAWRILWTAEPGGLPSMGSHRVRHDWSNLAAAAIQQNTKDHLRGQISHTIWFLEYVERKYVLLVREKMYFGIVIKGNINSRLLFTLHNIRQVLHQSSSVSSLSHPSSHSHRIPIKLKEKNADRKGPFYTE